MFLRALRIFGNFLRIFLAVHFYMINNFSGAVYRPTFYSFLADSVTHEWDPADRAQTFLRTKNFELRARRVAADLRRAGDPSPRSCEKTRRRSSFGYVRVAFTYFLPFFSIRKQLGSLVDQIVRGLIWSVESSQIVRFELRGIRNGSTQTICGPIINGTMKSFSLIRR